MILSASECSRRRRPAALMALHCQLRVAVRDMQAYHELPLGRLTGIEGVSGVHSSFVLSQFSKGLPVPKP